MQIVLNIDADSENLYSQVIEAAHQYLENENRLANIRQYIETLKHVEFVFNEEITEVCYICLILNIANIYVHSVYFSGFVFLYLIILYYFFIYSDYSR